MTLQARPRIKKKRGCEMRLGKVKRPSGAGVVGIFDP